MLLINGARTGTDSSIFYPGFGNFRREIRTCFGGKRSSMESLSQDVILQKLRTKRPLSHWSAPERGAGSALLWSGGQHSLGHILYVAVLNGLHQASIGREDESIS